MSDIRFGALCWNQYAAWPDLLAAGVRADRLGYDTLWTWDHLKSTGRAVVDDRSGVDVRGCDRRPLTAQ